MQKAKRKTLRWSDIAGFSSFNFFLEASGILFADLESRGKPEGNAVAVILTEVII